MRAENSRVSSDSSELLLALRPELIHGRYDVESPSVSVDWTSYVVMSIFVMRVVRVSVMCVCLVREGGGIKGG